LVLVVFIILSFKAENLVYLTVIITMSLAYSGFGALVDDRVKGKHAALIVLVWLVKAVIIAPVFFTCYLLLFKEPMYRIRFWNNIKENTVTCLTNICRVDVAYFTTTGGKYYITVPPVFNVFFIGNMYPYGVAPGTSCGIDLSQYFTNVTNDFFFFLGTTYDTNRSNPNTNAYTAFINAFNLTINTPSAASMTNLATEDLANLQAHYLDQNFSTEFPGLYLNFKLPEIYSVLGGVPHR
jgi:hypothetical protein